MNKYKLAKYDFEKSQPVVEIEFGGDDSKIFPNIKDDLLNQKVKAIRELISSIDYKRDCDCDDTQYIHALLSILDAIGLSMYSEWRNSSNLSTLTLVKNLIDDVIDEHDKPIFKGVFTNLDEDE